jgi:hypothetical protein
MGIIGRLSAWYYSTPRAPLPEAQAAVAQWLAGWDPEWRKRVNSALQRGAIIVFPQQLAHLARLVARHADPRPPKEFGDQSRRKTRCELPSFSQATSCAEEPYGETH